MDERAEENINETDGEQFVERRHGRDWVTKAITVFTGIGWGITIAMVILFGGASPERENFFTRLFNIQVSGYWNDRMLSLSLNALVAAFIFCLVGIVFNLLRHRRNTDHLNKALVILCIASAVGIFAFLTFFSEYF
ncbi:MAG: hypothetical protein LBS93_02420 [Synergistaceae bacterium]|jgi:uncharacterized membrane protein YfcA|nr:hypothetical protein [Synergistaceae bacterium]